MNYLILLNKEIKMKKINNQRKYMYFNVILTFNESNDYSDSQEFFDMRLPLSKKEIHSSVFLMKKFFPKILDKCVKYNRNPSNLIKISTASDWDLFEEYTGLKSLVSYGHSCKWYFGKGRNDLDWWENMLMEKFGFGVDADLSFLFSANLEIDDVVSEQA